MSKRWLAAPVFALCVARTWAIAPGTSDTFEDATTQGWSGAADPNVSTGGPAGPADLYLSAGQDSFRPHLAIKNTDPRWAGDYTAAGVTQLEVDVKIFSGPDLSMRAVLFGGPLASETTSTNATVLPADGQWHHLTFDITAGALTTVSGTDAPADVLHSVFQLMFRHQEGTAAHGGTFVLATAGFDNITAVGVAPPLTITQWRSVRTHTGAGDLPIVLNATAGGNGIGGPTVETRQGGIQRIEVQFSVATSVTASAVTVTGRSTVGGVLQSPVVYTPTSVSMASANTLALVFSPSQLPDQTCYTIDISPAGVTGLTGDHDVIVRSLVGDVTMSGDITLSDAILTGLHIGAAVAGSPQYDINLDSIISFSDGLAAKGQIRHLALCP